MITKLVDAVVNAANGGGAEALDLACAALIDRLPAERGSIDAAQALRALKALRKNRHFAAMRSLAQAFLDDGCREPEVTQHFAQAMIEGGEIIAAIGVLERLVAAPRLPFDKWAEAKGTLGRAWKDRAIRARGTRDDVAREATRESVRHYRDAWNKDNNLTWQGVNYVAVAAWDGGFALSRKDLAGAKVAARRVFETIEALPEAKRSSWDYASAGEALLGLGRYDEALRWFGEYALREHSAFALSGTMRQLNQLWRAEKSGWGRTILAGLVSQAIGAVVGERHRKEGGKDDRPPPRKDSFSILPEKLETLSKVPKARQQAMMGKEAGLRSADWMDKGAAVARSIAMIRKNDSPHGTGFVVRGSDLEPSLGDGLFVVTNAHVVSDPPSEPAAGPSEAGVTLERSGGYFRIKEIAWQSPPDRHDISVLRLDQPLPQEVEPLSLATALPALDNGKARAIVVGHFNGRHITYSWEGNLLDHERHVDSHLPCRVHYSVSTEQGNSGSPVFNENWGVIAVHHLGGVTSMLNGGSSADYLANQGIWIGSIKRAIEATMTASAKPPRKASRKSRTRKARR